jgi:hypothetical protein
MAEPTQAQKPTEQNFTYAVDQQVSVNAFFDAELNGENVRFQITSRYNSTAEKIVKTTQAAIEAFKLLRTEYPRTERMPAPAQPVQAGEKKPFELRPVPASEMPEGVPEGIELFKDEFDYLIIEPKPDGKSSVAFYKDGLKWPVGGKINNWKHDKIKILLAPLGDIDPSAAAHLRKAGNMFWSKGSEYVIASGAHQGEKSHYKDIRTITASF